MIRLLECGESPVLSPWQFVWSPYQWLPYYIILCISLNFVAYTLIGTSYKGPSL